MAYCPNCAAEVALEAIECPRCGASFGEGSLFRPMDEPPREVGFVVAADAPQRSRRLGAASEGALGVALIVLAFYLFFSGGLSTLPYLNLGHQVLGWSLQFVLLATGAWLLGDAIYRVVGAALTSLRSAGGSPGKGPDQA